MTRVVINGTFDIIHQGHLNLLETGRSYQSSHVLVLIDSDRRVQELKGPNRPINCQEFRQRLLSSLRSVDQVMIFDSDQELEQLIKSYSPHIMIKGSDYRNRIIIGAQHCQQIVFVERDDNSSSLIIEKIKGIA